MGQPRKQNYHGRWEVLIEKCTRTLNKLLEMACSRRRNYILDQVRNSIVKIYIYINTRLYIVEIERSK